MMCIKFRIDRISEILLQQFIIIYYEFSYTFIGIFYVDNYVICK